MPRTGTGSITIHFPEAFYLYINKIDYTEYVLNYEFKEQRNNISEFVVDLFSISSTERADVSEGNDVQLRFANNLVFKGIIERADYKSYEYCTIKGLGATETVLKNNTVEWRAGKCLSDSDSSEGRPVYTGTTSGVSTNDIVSGQLSGISTVSVNTNDYLGHLVARADHDNVLSFLDGMVRSMSGVWWSSYGSFPYATNYLNVSTQRGTGVSAKVFNVSGDDQNANETSREVDEEALWTSISTLGYGDGQNQLRSKVYHATDNFTKTLSGCTASEVVITVENISVLPATGTVWVGMEQVPYTGKAGNALTGCIRPVHDSTDSSEQEYLAQYAHSKGVAVYDAQYTEGSTDGNSKIDTYGVRQKTLADKRILSQDALDQAAVNILIDHYTLKERIRLTPSDLYACIASGIAIDDSVTVTDSESGLSGDYVVVGRILKYNEGLEDLEYELSNTRSTFTEDLRESEQLVKVGSQYMQGSTTAFNVQSYENCSNSEPLNLRVYLPDDLIKVNKALLSFKVKDFRAYTTATPTNSEFSPSGYAQITGSLSNPNENVWTNIASSWTPSSNTSFMWVGFSIGIDDMSTNDRISFRIKNTTDTSYFPAEDGVQYTTQAIVDPDREMIFFSVVIPGNVNGKTFQVQLMSDDNSTVDTTIDGRYILSSDHTHSMFYTILTSGVATQTVDVAVGPDGSEGTVATDLSDQEAYDITNWITSGVVLSDGNWMNVKITPPAGNPLRIEGNIFMKCFIQAK